MDKIRKYKIRKSGNSDVTTIPNEVKEYIGVKTGESISYIFDKDGAVRIVKAQEEIDIDTIVDSVMNQYDQALKDLVDL
ncbi:MULTISPECIES: addiction module antitoxin [Enterococcus]|uniref:AbrB family transcriptional regulator n=1 Tax=Enterococcus mundtii TaxID=53346 RepID=A0A1L8V1K1_ENTMU|nr:MULTISPECIES: addiction module antitoxin [Enterococcus]GEN17734.1 AbrB family transcriptional regulator [Ligilactobacillus acidipiscis]AUB52334.1 addiction module antitoxin [Enterococcus mundtii]MDB7086565.1 addiction module antitoxin [Enterococcus mundtii]MZZ58114.1 addiction module antitoxin [Enterococcus mundtii]MZZ61089.1 addiction module antitoxin [Enterococcus mundtii]